MKKYTVFTFNLAIVPLNKNTKFNGEKLHYFDQEKKAIEFAKSVRNKWDRVYVYLSEGMKEVVSFHGDNMYTGDERVSLKGS